MSTKLKLIIGFILIVITGRLVLPHIMLNKINSALADLDGYRGHIDDLDLNLYRGGFELEKITIDKINAKVVEPFFAVDLVDLSVDWDALLNGKFTGEIRMIKPVINFAIDSTGEVTQTGKENNWVKTVRKLVPIEANLNVFAINNGTIKYSDYSAKPYVEVNISSISVLAKNLSNVKSTSKDLPASFEMTGISDGSGQLTVNAELDFLKEIPDFDLDFELKDIQLEELNAFTKAYGNFDTEGGTFSLFSEVLMENGEYDGYVKPLFENVKILDLEKEKEDSFFQKIWEGIISVPAEVFENQKEDRVATKSPFQGSVENTDMNLLKTIGNTILNAFVEAIPKKLDNTIYKVDSLD